MSEEIEPGCSFRLRASSGTWQQTSEKEVQMQGLTAAEKGHCCGLSLNMATANGARQATVEFC